MDQFFQMAEAGNLPAFSYIEPSWGGAILGLSVMGNEYHPPSDVTPAEHLLKQIYLSLTKNKAAWEQTLLVIVFDEHGGTYDHEIPPEAIPPWGSKSPVFPKQYDFNFNRFGVRIPAILVSPLIEEGTVFRSKTTVPYDHTSIIATILDWVKIPQQDKQNKWGLGVRVSNAPTFDNVLTRTEPRKDNIFAPIVPPSNGTPLKFGDSFYLKHKSDSSYVTQAYSGVAYYFPTLGVKNLVRLDFRLGWGEVQSGAIVQIRTEEYLTPNDSIELTFAGIRNFLGAWLGEHDCYYYSTDDAKNYKEQYWTVSKVNGSSGAICYGDEVYIASYCPRFLGQRLTKDGEYISTALNANDCWVIERPS
jgi:phospholipase C